MPKHTPKERAKRLSKKVSKVRRDSPSLTSKQAVGKAAGILRGKRKKKK